MPLEVNTWANKMLLNSYHHIWFCGLAASGKTTALKTISDLDLGVNFYNDSSEILDFIKLDTQEKFHVKPTPTSFILTSSKPVKYSIEQLIKKVSTNSGKNIIELSRGIDLEAVIDFTYKDFFSQLPENIKNESLIVYLHSSFEERISRNNKRSAPSEKHTVFESFHCPQEAMKRFFSKDDFFDEINSVDLDALIIANTKSIDELKKKIISLFKEQ